MGCCGSFQVADAKNELKEATQIRNKLSDTLKAVEVEAGDQLIRMNFMLVKYTGIDKVSQGITEQSIGILLASI